MMARGVNVRDVAHAAPGTMRPAALFRASEIFDIPAVRCVIDLRGGHDKHDKHHQADDADTHGHHKHKRGRRHTMWHRHHRPSQMRPATADSDESDDSPSSSPASWPASPANVGDSGAVRHVRVKFITPRAAMRILWGTGVSTLVPAAASDNFKVTMAAKAFKYLGLRDMYKIFITSCQSEIKKAIVPLADPTAYPVVIHCIHGKDRTGVCVALVLALMGATEAEILADYGRSAEEIHSAQERGDIPEGHAALSLPPEYITSDPVDLRDSLFAHLSKKHAAGTLAASARHYLERECRLSAGQIDAIQRNLAPVEDGAPVIAFVDEV